MSSSKSIYHRNKKNLRPNIELIKSQLVFKSRVALKHYLTKIAAEIYDIQVEEGHKYYNFLCDMIERHYFYKYEQGMKFVIHTDENYELSPEREQKRTPYRRSEYHRCYVFIPSENNWTSISLFNKCVFGRDENEKQKLIKEYRKCIEPQIKIARKLRKWECESCQATGLLDIDHYPKLFCEIVKEFEEQNLISDFAQYHEQVAQYRLLCKTCHYKATFG